MGMIEPNTAAATLFAELADDGSTQRDEALRLELMEDHHQILRDTFTMFRGREVASTVGGLLLEFDAALEAVRCAVEFQRTLAERNEKKSEERQIQSRIGIHSGQTGHDEEELGVKERRPRQIALAAEPGGICVTDAIYEQVGSQVPQPWVPLAPAELQHIQEAGVIYRLLPDVTPETLAEAGASRKQLQWLVLGVLVLNAILFLTFGVKRNAPPASSGTTTNQSAGTITNGR